MVDITAPPFLELLNIISGENRYNYYTEMYHCQAILHHADHLDRFVGTPRSNIVVQLGGSDPEAMAKAAKTIEDYGYSEVNINVGCPSQNVQSGKFGAVLMKTPQTVAEILSSIERKNVRIPVSVKCRIGVDHQDDFGFLHNFVSTILHTKQPMTHLIVHARKCILKGLSPKQNRTVPPLNYDRVFELAKTIPDLHISINGGFTESDQVEWALGRVDGCMIGRKVMDDPLFLQELDQTIYKQKNVKSLEEIVDAYLCKCPLLEISDSQKPQAIRIDFSHLK
ncbi:tRNA-dihydrouridine synthase [Sporodiniella umbellata]|nr:tRNA-dihydrouridine synthase [Sporodiniella umbellata]